MKVRWLWLLLLIVVFYLVAKPGSAWTEMRRSWARREWIVTVVLILVGGYLLYGIYTMVNENTFEFFGGSGPNN